MHVHVRCFIHVVLGLGLAMVGVMARAQAAGPSVGSQAAASAVPAATGTLHGHIADQTGALIPGAQITVTTAKGGKIAETSADSAGGYAVRGL
ncbi:MAG: carboxypeptidase-like regulatory domain-containing protein, partial [Terracidiphilus sp.]